LQGASALAVAVAVDGGLAQAQTAAALRGAAHMATTAGVPAIVAPETSAPPMSAAMTSASARAILNQANAASAVSLAQQAQAAARASAAALNPAVGDGLYNAVSNPSGGLRPAVSTVAAVSADPTGLATWQGAALPVASASNGQTTVTVSQSDPRAILSWTNFNVGANTTLAFAPSTAGAADSSWVTLNRVVGPINPATGLQTPGAAPAPSQILGKITSPWEIVVINANGVVFTGTSQVDAYSLVATSLEIGQSLTTGSQPTPLTIAQRNQNFLTYGLVGYAEQASVNNQQSAFTFSAPAISGSAYEPTIEGPITIQAGAQITSASTGFLLFAGPQVTNAGTLSSPQGQVSLESGREIFLQASDGTAGSVNPNVRGFVVSALNRPDAAGNFVVNAPGALIEADDGYISLGATANGAASNQGVLLSSTSIARNGYIQLTGGSIDLAAGSAIEILPDNTGGTIPQDATSLADFKTSAISIGDANTVITIDGSTASKAGALIYAPSANVQIGAAAGATTTLDTAQGGDSGVFVGSGAVIDVAGLTNVEVSASTNSVQITPITTNDLQDSPNDSALLGATVYIDPRLSGVRSDGVAWVGSPIIAAAGFAQQVGVQVTQLMTQGGNVTLGVASANPANLAGAPQIVVKPGAVIDVSGGWVAYDAGWVRTTNLLDSAGEIVNIANANPNATYVGVYTGYTSTQSRWGVSQTYADPIQNGLQYEGAYTEGHDAGSLSVVASVAALDGTVYAGAFAGAQQLLGATPGTAASSVYGDVRALQSTWTQLPAGGYLSIQAYGVSSAGGLSGGADIEVTAGPAGSSTASLTAGAALPTDRYDTILLSASALSGMGLSELSLQTSGKITVDSGADLVLAPGGDFTGLSGRALTINGTVTIPSGAINLTTAQLLSQGSVILPDSQALGSYDITINGALSVAGLWTNDDLAQQGALKGASYLSGGSITLAAAPSVTLYAATASVTDSLDGAQPAVNTDISGSILINSGALLNLSTGGYVSDVGALTLTDKSGNPLKGGNLTLTEETTYFQLTNDPSEQAGAVSGIRVTGLINDNGVATVAINPATINARVTIAPGTILADGFAGGTFTLTTPAFSLGSGVAATGTELPLNFFQSAGFGTYNITSYQTGLQPNTFDNGLGGYNAVLQTQVLTVGAGQVLNLTQTNFSPLLSESQINALRNLPSGGSLYSVLTPAVAPDSWDQRPINLALGGLIELNVAQGGQVTGAPGASLTVSLLNNQGVISLPGGTLTQSEILPSLYASGNVAGVGSLAQLFGGDSQGVFLEDAGNALGLQQSGSGALYTNAQVVATDAIYLLGDLAQGVGVQLAPGSVTDLSGVAVINPRATEPGQGTVTPIVSGKVLAGGVFQSLSGLNTGANLFATPAGQSLYQGEDPVAVRLGDAVLANGATLNVSGASAVFDQQGVQGDYAPTLVWSNGGSLTFGGGVLLQNVALNTAGGAPLALGGTLTLPNLILSQAAPTAPTLNALSANQLEAAGVATLVDEGGLSSDGAVVLKLSRGFFLTSGVYGGLFDQTLSSDTGRQLLSPTISANGDLEIDAPYIALQSSFQSLATPATGTPGAFSVTFSANAIDVTGAVLADQSVGVLNLVARQDLRLIGVAPWQQTYNVDGATVANSLAGHLAVNGDLNITAAQVYPTTGSTFIVSSAADDGTITFAATAGSTASAPYSAGGALLVQAANIVQGGIVRTPLGALTLGANTPLTIDSSAFAPATTSLTILSGSTTTVSAGGLSIPYGTTTDQTEWYFTPTNANPLTAPPAGVLTLSGQGVTIQANATVSVSGGGDIYAYEFVPGAGGSRDLLSQFNTDQYSSNAGYQYPDHRQVYAIVPGLSSAVVAPYDPIYSSNYSSLYGPSQVGLSVYLNAGPGLAAGWYTLLPAQYAMLPGGMRVVQDTTAASMPPAGGTVLKDGTVVVSGQFGVAGAGSASSSLVTFDVQSQATFEKYSDIVLTSGDTKFASAAATTGATTSRLPIDAGQLVLAPVTQLSILSAVQTTPAAGGRGAEVDISGANLDIVSTLPATPADGVIAITASALTQLNAASLLLGGVRTDNSDGTTSLTVTAQTITVENKGSPLEAPEVILAVDGQGSQIDLKSGTNISATGTANPGQLGDFLIAGGVAQTGQGALVQVSNGAQRLVTRTDLQPGSGKGKLVIGSSVTLDGESVLLDSTGAIDVNDTVKLTATNLAVVANAIDFSATRQPGALTINPALEAKFAAAATLTLVAAQPVSFDSGTYSFGALNLDTPGFYSTDNGSVTLTATQLNLKNSTGVEAPCDPSNGCGTGTLQINAAAMAFGDGMLSAPGFSSGVGLTAQTGIYAVGAGGLDTLTADLTIQSPFIGDKATPTNTGSTTSAAASLTLNSQGMVSITNPGGTAANAPEGTPGASLTIDGAAISIDGTTLRATAGGLSLVSETGVSVTDRAVLETPGYSKSFGDSADPYSITAPGGALSLTAQGGDIDLDRTTTLSVGGGAGAAGTLSLIATGVVNLGATINAAAPDGGASLSINTGGGFDLAGFETAVGSAFTGNLAIRTASGNLMLAAGQTLTAANVSLTADGGLIDLAGQINVTGVNGGSVALYGTQGVTLESGSAIYAQAQGYASPGATPQSPNNTDTRQATGGQVTIGTAGSGAILVNSGALIDVSALNPSGRFVPLTSGGIGDYSWVAPDVGGTVTFRAPVFTQNGALNVNVTFAGQVKGASSVVLEGYQAWDLGVVAASGAFVGVTQTGASQVTLDLTQAGSPGAPNFLADNAAGTLVNFIQTFDLTAATPQLGSLTNLSAFVERPGVELDYSGDIVLASNWNLGAGTVNVAGAVKAGLMAADPALPGEYYVIPGNEAAVFSSYTSLTYRTGGLVTGQPGALTLRAGGQLSIDGSITDGFFTFADQTDAGYVSLALGGGAPGTGARVEQAYLTPSCSTGSCAGLDTFSTADTAPANVLSIQFPSASGLSASFSNPIPYSAAANAPDSLGSLATPTAATGGGDPIGSAELFPLLAGSGQAVQSWSYRLVGGAEASANPLHTAAGSTSEVVVQGLNPYILAAATPATSFAGALDLEAGGQNADPSAWLGAYNAANSRTPIAANAYAVIDFSLAPAAARSDLSADVAAFFAAQSNGANMQEVLNGKQITGLDTTVAEATAFMAYVNGANAPAGFGAVSAAYKAPNTDAYAKSPIVDAPTLIRTGTGAIDIAAAGTIDLTNGATPTLLNPNGQAATAGKGGLQVGGVAIYTAGHEVASLATAQSASGAQFSLDTSGSGAGFVSNPFLTPPANGYRYGAGAAPTDPGVGFSDILLADPTYATGGGDITLTAGQDILGRRDVMQNARLNNDFNSSQSYGYSWIGQGDQPWRTGFVSSTVDIRIDPQLFQEGVGTLGGGSITITAAGNVSDLSVVNDTTVATAQVSQTAGSTPSAGAVVQALVTYGGGNVTIAAGADVLGGRIDVASGQASIAAVGSIIATAPTSKSSTAIPNDLVLRLTDATVSLTAGGDVELQGITALGVRGATADYQGNLDAMGFYSPAAAVSIVADGAVTIDNTGLGVHNDGAVLLTPSISATGGVYDAVYPGGFQAVSLTGNLDLATSGAASAIQSASAIIMTPAPYGTLTLAAAGDISNSVTVSGSPVTTATVINMEDANPSLLPGAFSTFSTDQSGATQSGLGFQFNAVLSDTPETTLAQMHNSTPTHQGDSTPNRIYAGSDILNLVLEVPKQTRIEAGQDIIDMGFFGQNLSIADITRIVAGRDITATTQLINPVIGLPDVLGSELPAVQGDTFVIGGPGSFFLEAGRNAGPFLNSAITDGYATNGGVIGAAGTLTYGGGVLSVGNEWNPWLAQTGADIYTEFGVSKGQDFSALATDYLDPANLATMPSYLFVQTTNAAGISTPDRTQPIYGPILIDWMQAHAGALLRSLYGTTSVTFQQAYAAFIALPPLEQRTFLLKYVYFNELEQTSIPTSASYLDYARGYTAVNTLFPASLGYTANNLSGGANGASTTVFTGNLDLRLATIQTDQGGDIFILGPGGRVLAGSTVSSADQAARRAYNGGALFDGGAANGPLPSDIVKIPLGEEGILTLQGGAIYTFTDQSFLLNQSRLFTEAGGNILMWSSNADLNAGEGPKTSADFPPIAVTVDEDLYSQVNKDANVTGAGIAAFESDPTETPPNVYLIAPRGTVDAGAAGVRVAGNLFIAANAVANADNFKVSGQSFGIPATGSVNIGAQTSAGTAAAAAAATAQSVANNAGAQAPRSQITVNISGYIADTGAACAPTDVQCRP
jgi:filamentous hemagglutinin family protein